MPDFLAMVATLREQMQAELTRTDALRPLIWPIAGLLMALTLGMATGAPKWLLISLVAALGVMLTAYVVSYIFFAVNAPDALRSEKYMLHKMAIEHGLLGDSQTGLRKSENIEGKVKTIDALSSPEKSQ